MRGTEQAARPGTLERRTSASKETGIPLPDDHREILDAIAADLDVGPPAGEKLTEALHGYSKIVVMQELARDQRGDQLRGKGVAVSRR